MDSETILQLPITGRPTRRQWHCGGRMSFHQGIWRSEGQSNVI
jgi:hypothetical protein